MELYFDGPKGQTLFSHLINWCITEDSFENFQGSIHDSFSHIAIEDDRTLSLVGALITENAVDGLLAAYIPDYMNLIEHGDFTFSMKINLARSLRLCPTRLLSAADAIRKVRNEFAHDLYITKFGQCKPENIKLVHDHLRQINKRDTEKKEARELFKLLVMYIFMALKSYQYHVEKLNNYIRKSEEFMNHFKKYCQETKE